jgi:hypothetical protein
VGLVVRIENAAAVVAWLAKLILNKRREKRARAE